jgi:hypothetical protein
LRILVLAISLALALPVAGSSAEPPVLVLGDFAQGTEAWNQRIFKGETRYRVVEAEGRQVLEAVSEGSASALYRRQRIDLRQTPYLHWRWRIEATLGADIDERSKSGDDYPARIYLVRRGGLAFWRTRALNYVWSSAQPAGTLWSNAYAGDNVRMWAVDSGESTAGEWVSHSRDVRADWQAAFGEDIDSLDGIALMTDTDDTGRKARAWYADIVFSASPDPGPEHR